MTTRLIRPFPRVNDPKDIEKWYNELRHAVLGIATNTDSLPEGSTNLYFTNERSDDRVSALIQNGNVISWVYDDSAGTLTPTVGIDTTKGLDVSSSKIIIVLASNKGLGFDGSGDLYIIDGDGIKLSASGVEVDFNATNLKITTGALNTIQDIATTSSPTFVTVTGTTSCVGGTGGNDTTIAGTGVKQNGTARTYQDINFPALTLAPGAAAPTVAAVGPSGSILGLLFSGTGVTVESASGGGEVIHDWAEGTDIMLHIHWSPSTADAGDVKWYVDYIWTDVDEVDAAPTTVSAVDTAAGVAWTHQLVSVATISGTGKKIGSHFQFRVYRDPADVADTYAANAQLRNIGLHYEQDTLGSRSVVSKT